jgi:hypothetical protein
VDAADETSPGRVTLADELLPAYDVRTRHAVTVAAPASAVWAALHRADFASAWYVRALLMLRGLRRPAGAQRLTLERLVAGGFIPLGRRAGRELALGLVARPWTPSGGRVRVTPGAFRDFAVRGNAKIVWTFLVEPTGAATTRLSTETRVACTDAASRRRFRLYWLVVGPFSGWIRRAMLAAVAREATHPAATRAT